jgi:dihydroxyacid dehydratase/phosphogluconate dehydratase
METGILSEIKLKRKTKQRIVKVWVYATSNNDEKISKARSEHSAGLCTRAMVGGPIALVKDNDQIDIGVAKGKLDLLVSKTELDKRKKKWKPIKPHYTKGVLAKYASLVSSATEVAVTSPISVTFYKSLSSIDGNLMNFSTI